MISLLTDIQYIFRNLLIPLVVPLLFFAFWPRYLTERDLIRTGKLFVAKTILVCVLLFLTKVVTFKPLYQGSLLLNSYIVSFAIYLALTGVLVYFSSESLRKNKVAWIFLLADLLISVPYFIWQIMFGFELSKSFYNGLDFLVKYGGYEYYFYALIPTLITTIIFSVLSMYLVRQLQSMVSTKSE